MRRKYLGLAIAAITAFGPATAFGGDREIANEIMTRLKSSRDAGALKGFTLDMKVEQGIVLFRGSVSESVQKQLVLKAADGVEGVAKVVDELAIKSVATPKPQKVLVAKDQSSLRELLAQDADPKPEPSVEVAAPEVAVESAPEANIAATEVAPEANIAATEVAPEANIVAAEVAPEATEQLQASLEIAPGEVQPTAAVELAAPAGSGDQHVVSGVVTALGNAQKAGRLKGFGVDVKCNEGIVTLKGQASSATQRQEIISIAQAVPGVEAVDQMIVVPTAPVLSNVPAQLASNRMNALGASQVPTMAAPYAAPYAAPQGAPMPQAGAPVMGTPVGAPVPMAYRGAAGAPRLDSPNLPNYAWPGYASYPNYAALTYPQQYSPSAWPYIGPFYPYPQVPLGWRKVSLEWDDGWWFLDFTDR